MIVYFWHKSKVGQGVLVGLGILGALYYLFVFTQILKMDFQTVQIVRRPVEQITIIPEIVNNQATEDYAFVASKRGKYYYPKLCNKAKTLSIQNMLYFKDILSAESAGFKAFSGC